MSSSKFVIVKPPPESKGLSLGGEAPLRQGSRVSSTRNLTVRRTPRPMGKGGKKGRKGAPSLPQSLELVSAVPHVGRFSCTSNASASPVTRGSLGSSLGVVVTVANTTVVAWASSFRIVKIIIWPAVGSSPILEFPANTTAEQALQRETMRNETMPTGITLDRPLVWRPNAKSYLSQWQTVNTNAADSLFLLSQAVGTVMDVHVVFTLASGVALGSSIYGASTSSTVPLGTIGYMPIDTGNKIQPIGLSTILH